MESMKKMYEIHVESTLEVHGIHMELHGIHLESAWNPPGKCMESIWKCMESIWKCMESIWKCMESMWKCMESMVGVYGIHVKFMEQNHSIWIPPGMWGHSKVLQSYHLLPKHLHPLP